MFEVTFSKTFSTGMLAGLTVRNQRMSFPTRERAEAAARELDGLTLKDVGTRDVSTISDVAVRAV